MRILINSLNNIMLEHVRISRFLVILLLLFSSCDHINTGQTKNVGTLLWLHESHDDTAIKKAVHATLENTSIIVAQLHWKPNDEAFFQNVQWYCSLARDHQKKFMISIDWQKVDRTGTNGHWSFEHPEVAAAFKHDIKTIVREYKPELLNLGVEVNYLALTSPESYRAFIRIFEQLKNELARTNPKIKVGLSFQLELLYGRHRDWKRTPTLAALNAVVEALDFIGVSSYPYMYDTEESSLRSVDFLDSIKSSYQTPLGISETGISSTYYSQLQREKYIQLVFEKTKTLDLTFVIWGSVIDEPQETYWYDKNGLLQKNGDAKAEFFYWEQGTRNIMR